MELPMARTTKIAISLPKEILNDVELERQNRGESRSQFFRHAVEMLLKYQREQKAIERYIRAYKRVPETKEEITAARHSASTILAEEPWQ
jgi:metal-responsive CopG/Arc/MetJ family transcriptional regulator